MSPFQILFLFSQISPDAFVQFLREQGAKEIRIQFVQMDSDPENEAVVQYEQPGTGTHAIILDTGPSGWNRAGAVNAWWSLTPADRERFVSLHPSVDSQVQDLFVRTRSGGTEEERITFEIYRMRKGVLVSVFSVAEYLSAMEHPSGEVFNTSVRVHSTPGRIVTDSVRQPGDKRLCTAYRWDAGSFRFQQEAGPAPNPCK